MDYLTFSDIYDSTLPNISFGNLSQAASPVSEATLNALVSYGEGDKSAILEVQDFLRQGGKLELAALQAISTEEATV